jgi:hypothetical protein
MQMSAKQSRKPTRALQATAYPEAGHAVIAHLFNVPFRREGTTIVPDGNAAGCVYTRSIVREKPDVSDSVAVRVSCERMAMVSLAGDYRATYS